MNDKPASKTKSYLSKTLWVAVLTAIAAFFPPVKEWIADNPSTFSWAISGLFFVIRLVTKNAVSLK